MSNSFTPEQIKAQYASLPVDMREVISSSDTATRIEEIGRQKGMRIDKIGVLIEYSALIMLGLIKSGEFVNSLVKEAGVGQEQAEAIAIEIDTEVFSRVRDSLRQAQYSSTSERRFAENAAESAPTTASTAPVLDLSGSMSGSDYNAASFNSTEATVSVDRYRETVALRPEPTVVPQDYELTDQESENLDKAIESHVDEPIVDANPVDVDLNAALIDADRTYNVPVNTSASPLGASTSIAEPTDGVVRISATSATDQIVEKMPKAMQDAYKSGQATAPAPAPPTPEILQNFKQRLEHKMASGSSAGSSLNADPYKESI